MEKEERLKRLREELAWLIEQCNKVQSRVYRDAIADVKTLIAELEK